MLDPEVTIGHSKSKCYVTVAVYFADDFAVFTIRWVCWENIWNSVNIASVIRHPLKRCIPFHCEQNRDSRFIGDLWNHFKQKFGLATKQIIELLQKKNQSGDLFTFFRTLSNWLNQIISWKWRPFEVMLINLKRKNPLER